MTADSVLTIWATVAFSLDEALFVTLQYKLIADSEQEEAAIMCRDSQHGHSRFNPSTTMLQHWTLIPDCDRVKHATILCEKCELRPDVADTTKPMHIAQHATLNDVTVETLTTEHMYSSWPAEAWQWTGLSHCNGREIKLTHSSTCWSKTAQQCYTTIPCQLRWQLVSNISLML